MQTLWSVFLVFTSADSLAYIEKGLSAVHICIYLWKQSCVFKYYFYRYHCTKCIFWYSHQLTAWLVLSGAYQQSIYVYIYGSKVVFLGIVSTDTMMWIFGIHISWHPTLHLRRCISSSFMHIYGSKVVF